MLASILPALGEYVLELAMHGSADCIWTSLSSYASVIIKKTLRLGHRLASILPALGEYVLELASFFVAD